MFGLWVGAGIAMAGFFLSIAWMYAARLRSKSDQRRAHLEQERKVEKMKMDGSLLVERLRYEERVEEQKTKYLHEREMAKIEKMPVNAGDVQLTRTVSPANVKPERSLADIIIRTFKGL